MNQLNTEAKANHVIQELSEVSTASEPPSASLEQAFRGHAGVVSAAAFHPTNQIGNFRDAAESIKAPEQDDDSEARGKCVSTRHPCQQIASADSEGTVMIYNVHGGRSCKDEGKIR